VRTQRSGTTTSRTKSEEKVQFDSDLKSMTTLPALMATSSQEDGSISPRMPDSPPHSPFRRTGSDGDFLNYPLQLSPGGKRADRMRLLKNFVISKHGQSSQAVATDEVTTLPGESPPTTPGTPTSPSITKPKKIRWNKLTLRRVFSSDKGVSPKEMLDAMKKSSLEELLEMLRECSHRIQTETNKWVHKFLDEEGMEALLSFVSESQEEDVTKKKLSMMCIRSIVSRLEDCPDVRKTLGIVGNKSELLRQMMLYLENDDLQQNVLDILCFFCFSDGLSVRY